MDQRELVVPVTIGNNSTLFVVATLLGGEEEVASSVFSFDKAISSIEELAKKITMVVNSIKPEKADIEFGLKFTIESGKLSALLVNGQSEASIKVTLRY